MDEIRLFTDGSVNPQSKAGCGAYLLVTEPNPDLQTLQVKLKRFEQTSSTKLEIQVLLWALEEIKADGRKIIVYTDSQNIVGLLGRREKMEKQKFRSKNNKLLHNHALYDAFFKQVDQLNCTFCKVRGHLAGSQKDETDKLFTLVDRAARKGLRGGGG